MNLEKFKTKNPKKQAIVIGCVAVVLLIAAVILIRTYALFEVKNEYNVIKGVVSNYNPSDITITSYMDGTPSNTFPKKDSEYAVEKVECNNGAIGLWNYSNWEINIKNLSSTKTKCKVYFVTKYKEGILNGTDPVISENLIPVTIENDGTVKRADIKSEWYKYENKIWANAIILEDETKTYQNGEVIPESNIESYFVWIPRYKYKIFDNGNYTSTLTTSYVEKNKEIEVVFENKNTSVSNGSTVGSYLSHPAFTAFNSNGMWIGKFETGYKNAKNTSEAWSNTFNTSKIVIKSDQYAWTYVNPANAHLNSYNYQRSLDSHMMKNTEWGAVAYLQHSKYGSTQSVRINNTQNKITGNASVNEPTCIYDGTNVNTSCNKYDQGVPYVNGTNSNRYNTTVGYLASTTGNITGIYDMSGGAFEYVMALIKNEKNQLIVGQTDQDTSGFNGILGCPDGITSTGKTEITTGIDLPDRKYFDTYPYNNNNTNLAPSIFGDAMKEMGPTYNFGSMSSWYQDSINSITTTYPWIARGIGYYNGAAAGIFSAYSLNGFENGDIGYRIVLTP